MAQFYAGIPHTVPLATINRQVGRALRYRSKQSNAMQRPPPLPFPLQCSSGLQAFISVAAAIQSGIMEAGIAGGVESMSLTDMASSVPEVGLVLDRSMGTLS